MTTINTNVKSLIAQQALASNNRSLSKAMEQLSTGKRINSAADDAAGLAISNKMTAQIRSINQAVRNANDGMTMLQTADGALNEVTNMLQRMRELAIQSVNGTNSSADRTALDSEYTQLTNEITRISSKTTWNGTALIGASAGNVTLQIGAQSTDTMVATTVDVDAATGVASAILGGVDTAAAATSAIGHIDDAISTVDSFRSSLGAIVNRLNYAVDNLTNVSTNTAASRSRINDADYAAATTELARTQILQQAATAMLAQANQAPSSVLALLK